MALHFTQTHLMEIQTLFQLIDEYGLPKSEDSNGWKGCVCRYPRENQSCLRLKNIYENRDDKLEEECSECFTRQ